MLKYSSVCTGNQDAPLHLFVVSNASSSSSSSLDASLRLHESSNVDHPWQGGFGFHRPSVPSTRSINAKPKPSDVLPRLASAFGSFGSEAARRLRRDWRWPVRRPAAAAAARTLVIHHEGETAGHSAIPALLVHRRYRSKIQGWDHQEKAA